MLLRVAPTILEELQIAGRVVLALLSEQFVVREELVEGGVVRVGLRCGRITFRRCSSRLCRRVLRLQDSQWWWVRSGEIKGLAQRETHGGLRRSAGMMTTASSACTAVQGRRLMLALQQWCVTLDGSAPHALTMR